MKKGEKMSEETKAKIRASKAGKGNGRWGLKHSEETKAKMRKAAFGRDVSHLDWTGKTHSVEAKNKISKANKERFALGIHPLTGFKFSEESRLKMSKSHLGQEVSKETRKKLSDARKGDKHWNWKQDRSSIKKSPKKHLCGHYRNWMLSVKERDRWVCRLKDNECSGKLEAHHILNWCDYPHLRYSPKNGITLCQAHHPRGRAEEKRLEKLFQKMNTYLTSDSI